MIGWWTDWLQGGGLTSGRVVYWLVTGLWTDWLQGGGLTGDRVVD